MRNKLVLLIGFLSISFFSCDKQGVFEQNLNIPSEEWAIDSLATFSVNISDTLNAHNIWVNVRNTTNYPNSNLFLFITTHAPTGAILRDTLECFLASPKGNWLGKGFGRIRDSQIPYKRSIRFPAGGNYKFEIQHGMRTKILKEMVSVGIRIEKTQ